MKTNYFKWAFTLMLTALVLTPSFSQNGKSLWTRTVQVKTAKEELVYRKSEPKKAKFYQLNIEALKAKLLFAPKRKIATGISNLIIEFPSADGVLESYRIKEASIMEDALQAKFPDMRSYVGQSVDNPSQLIRFSVTPSGLNTMAFTENGTEFIDPYTKNGNYYIAYNRNSLTNPDQQWQCDFIDELEQNTGNKTANVVSSRNANDGMMRQFRLALACTVEYAQFHGGTLTGVMTAMTNTMTRVNGVYEKELSVTMLMVDNTSIIYLGPDVSSDPYTNNDGGAMLNQNQFAIDGNIGNGNYDIGHVFSTGGGGVAFLNSPCTGSKAGGVTGLSNPTGDAFDIDYVSHEMGHQYGGPHTFNGNAPGTSCLTQRTASNAYEPGSGSTIMGYAGICAPQNVQNRSDAYFHQKSLDEIFDNITNGNSQCATLMVTGNTAPTSLAGGDFNIPASTPYRLIGSSTDPNGTASHTYTWEEYDLGPTGAPTETTTTGPIVRSFLGTTDPIRYIPQLSSVLQNGGVSTTWEKLASVNRTMAFRLTVRDNDINGGQTAVDEMVATVRAGAGPFVVTSQTATDITWLTGETRTITWDVAGTTANNVNAANVNILLSLDGGLTYTTVLASGVPNDGSHDIIVPDVVGGFCRVMVEGAGNIFYNINSQDFKVNASVTTTCTTYSSAMNLGLAIPDGPSPNTAGTPVFNDINIPDAGIVDQIKVTVDVSHTYIGDLIIQIQDPNDAQFPNVWARNCNAANNDDITVEFDDNAQDILCATPTTGTYAPANPLSIFNAVDQQGDWQIALVDFYNGDTGTLNSWSIELCSTTVVSLSVDEFTLNNLNIYPNPNNGEFTIKFNSANSNKVNIQVFDVRGRSIINQDYDNNLSEFNQNISLKNAQSGMYLLNINDGERTITKKIIVE